MQLFKRGDVVLHKAHPDIKVVIIAPKIKILCQKYLVSYYDGGSFHTGIACEQELEKKKEK